MRKNYLSNFIPKLVSVLVILLVSFSTVKAQTDIIIGTGTNANGTTEYPCPLQDYWEGSRMQYLYLASELSAAGMSPGNVVALKYTVTAVNTPGDIEQFTIKMGTTATTSLSSSTWETVGNALFTAPLLTKTLGVNTFTLSTPFFWNGTDNIVVEVCGGDPNNSTGIFYTNNASVTYTTGLSFNGSHSYRTDNLGNLCGTSTTSNTGNQTTRPNIVFSWIPALACTGVPDAGTAVATPNAVCMGMPFNLKLSGGTVASGLTYQWQSSLDNITYTDIAGATTSNFNTTQLVSTYYRAIVTCTSAGGGIDTSNAVQVQSPLAVSGTFTINSALPTGGINFASFNDAYNYIKCGINGPVIFNVDAASGPYTEQLIMNEVPGASATNTITFNGNGRELKFLSTTSNERAVIKLDGIDHVRFDSLVITALGTSTSEYGYGIHLMNSADSNIINRCTININTTSTSTNYAGIVTSGSNTSATSTGTVKCDYNQFTNNVITGGYYSFTLVGSSTEANTYNQIKNNKFVDFYYYGNYIYGSFGIEIENNEYTRPNRAVVSSFYGIYFTNISTSAMVTRNRIHSPFGGNPTSSSLMYGIYFSSCDAFATLENKVINNLIYDVESNGTVYAIYNSSSDNIWYLHNTIVLDASASTASASSSTRGFYQTTAAGGIQFKNNIVKIDKSGAGSKYALYFNTATSEIESNYNDLYVVTNTGTTYTGYNGTNQATLADWQTASGKDLNSIANSPLFAGAPTGNFAPTNASMDNLGTPVNVLVDINLDARSATTPDMGAYEFTPGACSAPPTAGTALLSDNPVCVNSDVTLSVSGNSTGLGQTYRWESSAAITGPWTDISGSLTNPVYSITSSVSLYYRLAVTCTGNTTYTAPVLLTVNPALAAGTYTINAGAPASTTNFVSFNAAYQAMACGISGPVIVNVVANSGPYLEQLIIDSIAGTSAINTITFNGNGNMIQFSSNNTDERAVIKLRGADHITFDSLTIDASGTGTYGFGVHLINNADSNTINNCIINIPQTSSSSNYAGIIINSSESSATGFGASLCDANTISHNTINGGYYGITSVGGSSSQYIFNNHILNNKVLDFNLYGIYLYRNEGAVVEGNEISRPNRTDFSTFYGVYMSSGNLDTKVSKNRLHDPFAGDVSSTSTFYGIYTSSSDAEPGKENIISNNIMYNIKGGGTIYGMYNSSSDFTKYYHNSILIDDQNYTGSSSTRGFYLSSTTDSVAYKNNIVEITRTGSGDRYGIYVSSSIYEFISDYNNFRVPGTNGYFGYNGADRITLADWGTATNQDLNSLSTNPFFSDPNTGNLKPMSPVIDNKGSFVGITDDIENAVRSTTTPDIGAYEYTIPPCTAPPVAGATVATPNTGICMGTPIDLTLSGNSIGSGQTYQWQYSTTAAGPYTDLGNSKMFPDTTIFASATLYYRAAVTCSGNTVFSTPVLVSLNPAFLSGYYTINPALPPTLPNFQDFTTAVAALDCGITGFVTFDVASGVYNEQVRMHQIAGAGAGARVTFRSASGNAADVTLTYASSSNTQNYTLQLDSANYISYLNMTISATGTTYARAINFDHSASFDSISNCKIIVPNVTSSSSNVAGIYGTGLTGTNNTIYGNSIKGGYAGIYLYGQNINTLTAQNVIDSNVVENAYYYGIYIGYNERVKVNNNTVHMTLPLNSSSYAMYSTNSDSAFIYTNNHINVDSATSTSYGMYFTSCTAIETDPGKIKNNVILVQGNAGTTYGMYNSSTEYAHIQNNTISVQSTASSVYGSYVSGGGGSLFQNNSIVNNATNSTSTSNVAGYFSQNSGSDPSINIQNNIFSALGGGLAYSVSNLNFIYSNYNTYYTTGTNLIRGGSTLYATMQDWINAVNWDYNSITIEPALTSSTDLRPDLANPLVWAIHGRGVQIVGNDEDILGNPRPTTLTAGVPDMGAYEFLPTAEPTILTATPATPAPGITQTFMYGTDTVAKVTYSASAPVPASISLQRYSGVLPTGLSAGQESMYFYTKINVPAQGAYHYKMEQYYIDPWQGFIPTEYQTKMGRTDTAGTWAVYDDSRTDINNNIIEDTGVVYFDRYTGLTGSPNSVPPPVYTTVIDSSNRGTRFWVPYGHHYSFTSNGQDMWLYLSAEDSANVTVKINGTNWVRNYAVPANTVKVSDLIPKSGLVDARITDEGLFERGISITSDVPIVAYAHIYDGATSGASMLLPVGVYGYEYQSLNFQQYYPGTAYSWMSVMTDRDSTFVEITPAVTTKKGRPAGVPFTVMLMQGEVYNIMGTVTGSAGTDLTGTKVRSIANPNGKCYPIAVFSGSSRTAICNTTNGDNLIQQVFPSQAWGRKYLSFATANSLSNTEYNSNIFRIMVKDTNTVVNYNGAVLDHSTLQLPGKFYEVSTTQGIGTNGAIYVEADKPVMVAQYMVSTGAHLCPGVTATGNGDPEMIYISPIEQGIKKAVFYNTDESSINSNYVNVVIPTAGLASLTIDGATTFTDVFAHPFLAGYSAVRHNLGSVPGQHIVQSDSAFTAITYGLGSVESYGYNAGTLVKNLNALPSIVNTLGSGAVADYTCVGAPFRFNVRITAKPTVLTWRFSEIPTLSPNADVTQNNPVPTDSVLIANRWYYNYTVATDYTFTQAGNFAVPILITDPVNIEGCDNTQEITLVIKVIPAPAVDFTYNFSGCLGDPIQFNGTGTTSNGTAINAYNWNFDNGTTSTVQNPSVTYANSGTYNVNFGIIAADGCIADTTKPITINPAPIVNVVSDSLNVCGDSSVTFQIDNPDAGTTYSWYTDSTNATPVFTGATYTIPNVSGTIVRYVRAINAANCVGNFKRVVARVLPSLVLPLVRVDSAFSDKLVFGWDAVPNAISYEVSTDNGASWQTPTSGTIGLSHTITGLQPLEEVSLMVRARGVISCQESISAPVTGRTLTDQLYIPNAFSPNGDGLNDVLLVYGYTIKTMKFVVFNQWGQKIFESTNQATGWDGNYKNKPQPSGVYMYVCQIVLKDGTNVVKKGSINLVR